MQIVGRRTRKKETSWKPRNILGGKYYNKGAIFFIATPCSSEKPDVSEVHVK
jgi:hypothetical protein